MKTTFIILKYLSLLWILQGCTQKAGNSEWMIGPFEKANAVNPILTSGSGIFFCPVLKQEIAWENKDVFNPAVVVKDSLIYMLYRAEDTIGRFNGTSRIGIAKSSDGLNFVRESTPVFYPENDSMKIFEWEGGIEDPRVVAHPDGGYIMTYTAYDGKTARLCHAYSHDLYHWNKRGTVLENKYRDLWSKSGAIVVRRLGNNFIAEKINGYYWMYFGDTNLFLARSVDLLNWMPVVKDNALLPVLTPRPNKFDSRLVESGPFALITDYGIVLLYNGMNLDQGGDPALPAGAYCAGQALFSKNNPAELIDRTENYFLRPDQSYEIEGQVNQVCFIEGLTSFKNKWYLYYGTADSRIAVAVSKAE